MYNSNKDKVLFFGNDEDTNYIINSNLKKYYDLFVTSNYSEAIDNYKNKNPDLVLLDICPGNCKEKKVGLELLIEIRKKDKNTPIIVYTGYDINILQRELKFENTQYHRKGDVMPKDLREIINKNLSKYNE